MNTGRRRSVSCPPARRQVRHDDEVKRAKELSAKRRGHRRHDHEELGRSLANDHKSLMEHDSEEKSGNQ